ncbi:putative srpk [Podospora australis]|uniref:Srpk n=1 Tax=Podospora australis TaxID=1536484 RepID=A0AAN7AJI5_9PEZI|nr:putative srpk [Podospora australis]
MIPYPVMRRFTMQLICAIEFAHAHNVIHTDIQASNIFVQFLDRSLIESGYLVRVPIPHQDRTEKEYTPRLPLAIGDVASWADHHLTENIQPVALRAPEVLLNAPWDKNADWWNFGALLLELYRAIRMFNGRIPRDGHDELKRHLSEIVELFGPFPQALLKRGDRDLVEKIFDEQGRIKDDYQGHGPPLDHKVWTPGLDRGAREDFVSFLQLVMKMDPAERPTWLDMLKHVWLDAVQPVPPQEEGDCSNPGT